MAQLGQLQIIGQLSGCSTGVRVVHQVPGAQVELRADSDIVGTGTAIWTDQTFDLAKGLQAGAKVTAVQTMTGYDPSESSVSVTVDPKPTPEILSAGSFRKPFYQCGRCVWLYGLFPGADVQVFSKNEPLSQPAVVWADGQVQVSLDRPLSKGDDLHAVQTACQKAVTSKTPIQGGAPQLLPPTLPTPSVDAPTKCDRFITISNLTEGAEVTLWRGQKVLATFCSAIPTFHFYPVEKLMPVPEDSLQAQCAFPKTYVQSSHGKRARCGGSSDKSAVVDVQDKEPAVPKILPPLCADQDEIKVAGLEPGALLELTVNGAKLVFGVSVAADKYTVPKLQEGTVVVAKQNICGDPLTWGKPSPGKDKVATNKPNVPVNPSPPDNGPPITSDKPTLAWKDTGDYCNAATAFDLNVWKEVNGQKGASIVSASGLGSSKYKLPTLQASTTYVWRVRAFKAGPQAFSPWTPDFHFTTAAQAINMDPGQQQADDLEKKRGRCFVIDCCAGTFPGYRYKVCLEEELTHSDAITNLEGKLAGGCYVVQKEVTDVVAANPNWQPPKCGDQFP